jgi:cellobiose epimerase
MKAIALLVLILPILAFGQTVLDRAALADEFERALIDNELHSWYPRCVDTVYGGFLTNFDAAWREQEQQDKMIVTQARDVWTACKAALLYTDDPRYRTAADEGFRFLREKMWDAEYGGFFQTRSREGGPAAGDNLFDKTVYGNSFGLYAAAAYFELTHDPQALEFAQQIFHWIETYSRDVQNGGYFDFIRRDGRVYGKGYAAAGDSSRFGYKDQNPTIHLLESYSELYRQWPDSLLHRRLAELQVLVRDVITSDKGYMRLYFTPDWTPISHKDSSETYIIRSYALDHISFGHDIETAYLLLEASDVLGIKNDTTTLRIAKKMVDFTLANGWDKTNGGVYHAGYWFKGEPSPRIIKDEKDWWTQAEALNSLLMMSLLFPGEPKYEQAFLKQWQYITTFIIDWQNGSWFTLGIDTRPDSRDAFKAQAWKGPYHTSRALMNVVKMLRHGRLFDEH